ncbi:MAG: redoxin family protein [Parcubacteria group bacterium]|nr:redoxin family protein [Parcubacteria group bacterium]
MILFGQKLIGKKAPDFPKGLVWINSEELDWEKLKGKIVLVDFWTYSCVNCIRTLPFLKKWHERYKDFGLVIVGVHSPEFDFEKNPENVKKAGERFGLKYSIVLDPDRRIWDLYDNAWWPRKILINQKGEIVYDHIGEGQYGQTEAKIQELILAETKTKIDLPRIDFEEGTGGVCYPATEELYLGYGRGQIGNLAGYQKNILANYRDASQHKTNVFYLSGFWIAAGEYIESQSGDTANYLFLNYQAISLNLVMESAKDEKKAFVKLNDQWLNKDFAGDDVQFSGKGETFVLIKEARMYNLIRAKDFHQGEIKIFPANSDLRFYAFTFGGCSHSE